MMLKCPSCGGRVCAHPLALAALYFFYVWDVVLFGFLAYLHSPWYLAAMAGGWLILDFFTLYIPLAALRAKTSTAES